MKPGARLLLVDDNEEFLETFREILSDAGFRVTACSRGLSALLQAGKLRPDALILDLKLDDVSGIDVYRTIREDPDYASMLVVFVSGVLVDQEVLRSLTGDPTARLFLKPIPGEVFVEELQSLLESQARKRVA